MVAYSNSAKIRTTIAANTSNAAGATTTGTAVSIGDFDPREVTAVCKLTNGATGPTVAPTVTLQVNVGGAWKDIERKAGDTVANSVTVIRFRVPFTGGQVRMVVSGNTVQPVTITEAFFLGTN